MRGKGGPFGAPRYAPHLWLALLVASGRAHQWA